MGKNTAFIIIGLILFSFVLSLFLASIFVDLGDIAYMRLENFSIDELSDVNLTYEDPSFFDQYDGFTTDYNCSQISATIPDLVSVTPISYIQLVSWKDETCTFSFSCFPDIGYIHINAENNSDFNIPAGNTKYIPTHSEVVFLFEMGLLADTKVDYAVDVYYDNDTLACTFNRTLQTINYTPDASHLVQNNSILQYNSASSQWVNNYIDFENPNVTSITLNDTTIYDWTYLLNSSIPDLEEVTSSGAETNTTLILYKGLLSFGDVNSSEIYANNISTARLYATGDVDASSFTLNGDKITSWDSVVVDVDNRIDDLNSTVINLDSRVDDINLSVVWEVNPYNNSEVSLKVPRTINITGQDLHVRDIYASNETIYLGDARIGGAGGDINISTGNIIANSFIGNGGLLDGVCLPNGTTSEGQICTFNETYLNTTLTDLGFVKNGDYVSFESMNATSINLNQTIIYDWLELYLNGTGLILTGNEFSIDESFLNSSIQDYSGIFEETMNITVSGGIGTGTTSDCCVGANEILDIKVTPSTLSNQYKFSSNSSATGESIDTTRKTHEGVWWVAHRGSVVTDENINYYITNANIDEVFSVRVRFQR